MVQRKQENDKNSLIDNEENRNKQKTHITVWSKQKPLEIKKKKSTSQIQFPEIP